MLPAFRRLALRSFCHRFGLLLATGAVMKPALQLMTDYRAGASFVRSS